MITKAGLWATVGMALACLWVAAARGQELSITGKQEDVNSIRVVVPNTSALLDDAEPIVDLIG